MSRFHLTTLLAGSVAIGACLLLRGFPRWAAVGAVGAAYVLVFGLGVAFVRMGFFCSALCRGQPGHRRVALTFDDGPDPAATPLLLDLLKEQSVPASFFCVGGRASAHPAILRRMAAEGHTVGNHTYRHAWWTNFLFGRLLRDEIGRAQEVLREILGHAPVHYRSPMGLTSPHLPGVLRRLGLLLVGWDVRRPFDRRADPRDVVARVVERARDGSIILLHDGGARADALLRAVDEIVRTLRSRGYTFVSLAELVRNP